MRKIELQSKKILPEEDNLKTNTQLAIGFLSVGRGDKGGRGLGDKWFWGGGGGGGGGAEVWRRDLN